MDVQSSTSAIEQSHAPSRRAILAAGLGGLTALIAQALGRPLPARATHDDVLLGGTNTDSTTTVVRNTSGAAAARGLAGEVVAATPGAGSAGLYGSNKGPSSSTYGVHGQHTGAGRGVYGQSATGVGVRGQTSGASADGVFGSSPYRGVVGQSTSGSAGTSKAGVWGTANAPDGTGVRGTANASGAVGVRGTSSGGIGVLGEAPGSAGANVGVRGTSASSGGRGVIGENTASNGVGVYGLSDNGFGAVGVLGRSRDGIGVRGEATSDGFFTTYGVVGRSDTYEGVGVLAEATYAFDTTTYGIWAQSNANSGTAVMGYASNGTGPNTGVQGHSEGSGGTGVLGWAKHGSSVNYGVRGVTQSATGWAGYFEGNVHVTGTLTEGGGGSLIDHPLAPRSRYLEHSFVEAPERLNVYRGTVTLDHNGSATVRLPRYFGALNVDYSYQLTPIGPTSSVLYIAREISQAGTFRIAGGTPGQRVCWLVTGIRKDAWAQKHPLRVERRKRRSDEGKYLHPALYGSSEADAIDPPPRPVKRPRPAKPTAGS